MDLHFRNAEARDLERLQALASETIDKSYRAFIDDEGVDWFLSGPSDEYIAKNIDNATVAIVDADIVGFAVCKDDLIDLIMIDYGVHRRGIGSALLARCESKLFEHYDSIRLESFEANGKANRFYLDNGWAKTGAMTDTMSAGRKWIFEKKRGA